MNIVILDGISITPGEDLSWDRLSSMGNLSFYPDSTYEESRQRIQGADAVFFSKVNMDQALIDSCDTVRFLGITATGTDNLDIEAARRRGIACTNVPAYSTDAVAQHTIALLLELSNHVGLHHASVQNGEWTPKRGFCYWKEPLILLKGKSLGIVGYGNIGSQVAKIGRALGMKIHIYRQEPEKTLASDVVSLHIPATPETLDFINEETISKMKDGALLINTARGSLVDEDALLGGLNSGKLSGFAADVLKMEPPAVDHPLLHHPHAIITPHNAWSPWEMRAQVCQVCADNLQSFLDGGTLNRVDLL